MLKYGIRVFIFFFIFAAIYLFLTVKGFDTEEKKRQANTEFTDDINSKTKLLDSLSQKPDIVFIGSSTTKYHVSTNLFKSENMNIFNYGVEGHFFTTYPYMIQHAIKAKPKMIVISINVQELYYKLLTKDLAFEKSIKVEWENIRFFIRHYLENPSNEEEFNLVIRLLETFIEQREYFARYGYYYTDAISKFYRSPDECCSHPGMSGLFTTDARNNSSPDENSTHPGYKTQDNHVDNKYLDCPANMSMTNFMGYRCDNGDGIITKEDKNLSFVNYYNKNIFRDKKYNYQLVSILNKMLDDISQAGIKPVIVLLPQFENPIYSESLPGKTIHADIIDLTHFQLPRDAWYNSGHFNAKGRYIYSTELANNFRNKLNDSSSF